MTHPNPTLFGCVSGFGCTHHEWRAPGVFHTSRAVQPATQTPQAYAHEVIGHGIPGMCHIQVEGIGVPINSLMSGGIGVHSSQISGQLTELDISTLKTVYSSDLSPSTTRKVFIRAGRIKL